jgi:hypothetical protein
MDRRGTFFFALNPHHVSGVVYIYSCSCVYHLHRYHYYRSIASLGSGWVPLLIELALPNDESSDKFPRLGRIRQDGFPRADYNAK